MPCVQRLAVATTCTAYCQLKKYTWLRFSGKNGDDGQSVAHRAKDTAALATPSPLRVRLRRRRPEDQLGAYKTCGRLPCLQGARSGPWGGGALAVARPFSVGTTAWPACTFGPWGGARRRRAAVAAPRRAARDRRGGVGGLPAPRARRHALAANRSWSARGLPIPLAGSILAHMHMPTSVADPLVPVPRDPHPDARRLACAELFV